MSVSVSMWGLTVTGVRLAGCLSDRPRGSMCHCYQSENKPRRWMARVIVRFRRLEKWYAYCSLSTAVLEVSHSLPMQDSCDLTGSYPPHGDHILTSPVINIGLLKTASMVAWSEALPDWFADDGGRDLDRQRA
uniref:Uncharacterized protein n=1 Tax=Timema shepardi TaxID=629360 RepID=A0A7R9G495_TIMSH|nr:unnamed protein product [Timema shepardi]